MTNDCLIDFDKTGWSIAFHNCREVAEGVLHICHGWGARLHLAEKPSRNHVLRARVSQRGKHWRWKPLGAPKPRDWDRVPPRSAMRAITDVQDALLHWHLAEQQELIGIHAAAALVGDRLLLMPAQGFAGKSTLMACLAKLGCTIFGDDVVMLQGSGTSISSFGFSPRLRIPLPQGLLPSTRKFIEEHSPLASHGWTYLGAGTGAIAKLGAKRKVNAIILLDRKSECRTHLAEAGKAATLRTLLREHLPKKLPPIDIFNRLQRLASSADCLQLTYSSPDDAARLLAREFA